MWYRLKRPSCKHSFRNRRRGTAYSLSVVLILPIYILCLTFAIELNLLMNSHLALAAGLEAATHSTTVWSGHRHVLSSQGKTLDDVVHDSVVRAMVPFAFTGREEKNEDPSLATVLNAADLSPNAIGRYSQKLEYIKRGLTVQVNPSTQRSEAYFDIDVTFDSPICFLYFSPLLSNGRRNGTHVRTFSMSTRVLMSRSQFGTTDFGLPYVPQEALRWQ